MKENILLEDSMIKMAGNIYCVSDEKELQITNVEGILVNAIALENILNDIEEVRKFQVLITKKNSSGKSSLDGLS